MTTVANALHELGVEKMLMVQRSRAKKILMLV